MGLFDDQIRQRELNDEIEFENAFINIAGSVIGHKVTAALRDEKRVVKDAMDEILKFYHIDAADIPAGINGLDNELEYLLRPYGIMRRIVKLEEGWYKNAFGAMLGIKKSDESVVALIPSGISGYTYFDYETGKRVKVNRSNADQFEDEAMAFYTTFPLKEIGIKDIFNYCFKSFSKADVLMIALAGLAVALIGLFVPYINNVIFSGVVYSKDTKSLLAIAVFLVCVSISGLLFKTVQTLVSSKIVTKMDVSVEAATMIRVLSLPTDFFKEYSSGELSTRIEYLKVLCTILIDSFVQSAMTALFSLIYIFQIAHYAPALAVPALSIIAFTMLVSVLSTVIEARVNREKMERAAKVSGLGLGLITGIQKIKITGSQKRAFAKWGNAYAKQADVTYNYPLIVKLNTAIQTAITLIGTILMYYIAVKNTINSADFLAFNSAYALASGAFITLAGTTTLISQIKPILEMIKPILDAKPEISENKRVVNRLSGNIEMSDVCFRYDENGPYIINKLALKIKSGQYVAIVGKTGCGKSTLMRLLLGFETPCKGAIYYDGKDVNTLDLRSLRRKIGVVMQTGSLFQGDIFSNISISAPGLTLDEAWEAARLAGIDEDIEKMPMGMFTIVSEGGGGLSGGQKQRLMIARAIATKPKVLMFDEATSALDNITQKKIAESLKELKCTRIVIAHRLSTIKDCDKIIALDGGKIIEQGTYDELIERNGFVAELVKRQQIDFS